MTRSVLVAFDFDHTICEDNSDIVARKLISTEKIPKNVKVLYQNEGWPVYMEKIFELLYENHIDAKQIKSVISNIPPVAGIKELMLELYSQNCEIIIISHSNSLFIETWLMNHKLDHVVSKVYTNPAYFDENGQLRLKMFPEKHWCDLSEKNICKRYLLETHLNERKSQGVTFDKIAYVGDGRNDLCPILKLSENDVAFPRLDFTLIKLINDSNNEEAQKIVCNIVPWKTGDEILTNFREKIFS